MNKLVSIIVAVYNEEDYLSDTVDSILKQTYKNIEVLLVDDGSTDNSSKLCDMYSEKDHRVRAIHKKNGGLASSRNCGLDEAIGEYIAFVDGDDIIHETFIETLYNICENDGCDIAICDFLMVDEKSIKLPPQKDFKVKYFNSKEVMREFFNNSNIVRYWVTWDKMYKKEIFDEIRYPEGAIHEDMYVSHKLLWNASKIGVTNQYLHYYVQREGSITGRKTSYEEIYDIMKAFNAEIEFLYENRLFDEYAFLLNKFYYTLNYHYRRVNREVTDKRLEMKDKLRDAIVSERERIKQAILCLDARDLLSKLKCIYGGLSTRERQEYINRYGNRISETKKYEYGFPYEKISRNSKVAIYGAGDIGKSYYNQMSEEGYCDIVVWVDNSWINYKREGLPVCSIDNLLAVDFDYCIIAINNREVSNNVKQNLIYWGVNADKIINDVAYVRINNSNRERLINEANKISKIDGNKWFVMNTPDHDNLGDHLLSLGGLEFLKDYFPNQNIVEITGFQWDICKQNIAKCVKKDDVIFITGGGYMGDLWIEQDKRVKDIIGHFPNNRIIFLPQTFYYNPSASNTILKDKEFYLNKSNILFIHREKNSYEHFLKNVINDSKRVKLYPDTALYLNHLSVEKARKEGVIICLRMDKESVSPELRKSVFDILTTLQKNITVLDTVKNRNIDSHEREKELAIILNEFAHAALVITDRLHAMVMAAITGTPCIAVDNLSKKVSGVYEWIENLEYVHCVTPNEVDEKLIKKAFLEEHKPYDRTLLKDEFDSMARDIISWIS